MNSKALSASYLSSLARLMLAIVVLAGLLGSLPVSLVKADGGGKYRVGEVIVKLNLLTGATIEDINTSYSTSTLETLGDGTGIFLVKLPDGTDTVEEAEILDLDPRLAFAEPNFISQAPEANPRGTSRWGGLDPAPVVTQYATGQLNLSPAWSLTKGAGSVVAVLDTGVQLDHPALAASLTDTGFDFIEGDTLPQEIHQGLDSNQDGIPDEAFGHGTHVAGIVHLVAPEARIMVLRVLDADGNGDIFTLAQAILYAIENDANVINMSLGTPDKSEMLKQVVRTATRSGVVVVAAAGNANSKLPQYPAADGCALSVISVGPSGIKSEFANYDAGVDFAASGESIYSAFPVDGYAYWSGTSMATPFVAGQAALLHSQNPSLNPRDLTMYMGATAHSLDATQPQLAGKLGLGLVDVGESVSLLANGVQPVSNRGLLSVSCIQ